MLWGRNDQSVTANSTTTKESSTGAPMGTWALVKGDQVNRVDAANAHFGNTSAGSRAGVDANMFNNTTMSAFISGKSVGVFGADVSEVAVAAGNLVSGTITFAGSGYAANAAVTLTFANGSTNATAVNAFANVTAGVGGHIQSLLIAQPGDAYTVSPVVTIAAPAAININANTTGVSNTGDVLLVATANSKFQAGDRLYYAVPAGNTAIPNLTGNTWYYVSFANTTSLALTATPGGSNIDIAETRVGAAEVHTIQGETAAGTVTVSGGKNKGIAHAGWVLRTEGSGGRAGRVQYEVLVAMRTLGAQTAPTTTTVGDASDDTLLPDGS